MKKRVLAFVLAGMMAFSFTGCGGTEAGSSADTSAPSAGETSSAADASSVSGTSSASDIAAATEPSSASEEEAADPSGSKLTNVTHYPGEDERILFGEYVLTDRYRAFSHGYQVEFWEKYESELHFEEVEVEGRSRMLSVEPVEIECGYMQAGGADYPFICTEYEGVPVSEMDIEVMWNSFYSSPEHQSEKAMKESDQILYENMDPEGAMQISQNLRKVCDTAVMTMSFAEFTKPDRCYEQYVYKIVGDEILYTPFLINFTTLEMELPPESEWERMQFGFRGTALVLKTDNWEVELDSKFQLWYEYDEAGGYLPVGGWAQEEPYQNIINLYFHFNYGETEYDYPQIIFTDGSFGEQVSVHLDSKQSSTVRWEDSRFADWASRIGGKAGSVSFQFITASTNGFTLYDGEKLYYYYGNRDDWNQEDVDDGDLATYESNRTDVVSALQDAFAGAANVDEKTGTVTLDNGVLFAVDSDELSAEGIAYLDSFLKIYTSTIEEMVGEGKVRGINVVGHTDVSGSYAYNLDLSERRAARVAAYCIEQYPEMSRMLSFEGRSYSEPIYNADGTVDMAASRRVEFCVMLDY